MSTKADDKPAPPADDKKDDATKTDDKSKKTDDKKSDDAKSDDDKKPPVKVDKTFTKAELDAAAKKAVDDAQKKWNDEKDLTESERLKKENQELKEGLRLRDAREEVVNALTAAGANSPALAFDAIRGGLKFDEAGKLLNSKDLIEGIKTSYPEQFGTPKTTETIDAGKGLQGGGDKLTKDKLAKMTPTEINALDWKDVSAVMAGE